MSKWPVADLKAAPENRIDLIIRESEVKLHETASGLRGKGASSDRPDSLSVTPEKGLWNDLSTGEGGDVFTWLEKRQGMDYQSACQFLAERAGIEFEPFTPEQPGVELEPPTHEEAAEQNRDSRSFDALEAAWQIIEGNRPPALKKFIQDRGITSESISLFRIGMAPADLWARLEAQGFTSDKIMSTGLFRAPRHLAFAGRVLFPFLVRGRPVCFIGRATDPAQQSKYLKPKAEHLPDEGHLFGAHTVKSGEVLCIVEGPLDAVSCVQAGFPAVALSTANVTEKSKPHLSIEASIASEVVIIPDHDPPSKDGNRAGLEGAKKTAAFLWGKGVDCRLADLPPDPAGGKVDANSFIREHGSTAFAEVIEKRQLFPEWLLSHINPDAPQKTSLALFVEALAARDEIAQEGFLKAAKRRGISVGILRSELKKAAKPSVGKEEPSKDKRNHELECIARAIDESTAGRLACFNPPETPRSTPTLSMEQAEGHYLPLTPEATHDLVNGAAGRLLTPEEFRLVLWFLATGVLKNRGSGTLQTGMACANGFLQFEDGTFTPGRSKKPCQFFVPRNFLSDRTALPDPDDLEIIKGWKAWGQETNYLLELIARTLIPQPTGVFFAGWGPGGDGKSTFWNFVELLLGQWNVLRTSPYEFAENRRLRGIASLQGKLLALIDDAPEDVFSIMGTFLKEVSTAPTLSGAAVYENVFSFRNTCLVAILGNAPGKRKDHSAGFFDRYWPSIWPARIRHSVAQVENIWNQWAQNSTEMDIIFSYAVDLVFDFIRSGKWHYSNDREESEYNSDCLSTREARFLWERFEPEAGAFLPWDAIQDAFTAFWPDVDHRTQLNRERFLEALDVTWQGEERRRQVSGTRERGIVGLRVVPKGKKAKPQDKAKVTGLFGADYKGGVLSGQKSPQKSTDYLREPEKKKFEEPEKNEDKCFSVTPTDFAENPVAFSGHSKERPDLPELDNQPAPLEQTAACREVLKLLGRTSRTRSGLRAAAGLPHEAIDAAVTHLLYAGKIVIDEEGDLCLPDQTEGDNS